MEPPGKGFRTIHRHTLSAVTVSKRAMRRHHRDMHDQYPVGMTDELSQAQLAELETELRSLEVQLSEALTESNASSSTVELDQTRVGRVSRGDALQQQAMAQAGRRVLQERLNAVHAALVRLKNGDYGYCVDCDEPIALARLNKQPEAARCIGCQSAKE